MVEESLITAIGDYEVRLGTSIMEPNNTNPIYVVFNTRFGVVEAETSCLPQALMTAQSYHANVEEFFSQNVADHIEVEGGQKAH